jgi:hypothetical protein
MKKYLIVILIALNISCSDFLDIVPDNIPTIEMAFNNRASAMKYLYTCYSFIPSHVSPNSNPAMVGGDEIWLYPLEQDLHYHFGGTTTFQYALGLQNSTNPLLDTWSHLYMGIRECNIFVENIDKTLDMTIDEKRRWKSEALFIKAFLHYKLFQKYGPIPLIENNLPVSSSPEDVRAKRRPVSEIVNFIVETINEAEKYLPNTITNEADENGRITKAIAKCIKSKVLVLAASPLYSTSGLFDDFINKDGEVLFDDIDNTNKWARARDTLIATVKFCEDNDFELYRVNDLVSVSDTTRAKMEIRNTVTVKWNKEQIWSESRDGSQHIQQLCQLKLKSTQTTNQQMKGMYAPTFRMAEAFYTKNGVPIDEDKTFDYDKRFELKTVETGDRYLMTPGYQTAKFNFDREFRFYGSLGFDGSRWFGNGRLDDANQYDIEMRARTLSGKTSQQDYSQTGYIAKKLTYYKNPEGSNTGFNPINYSFPKIRLADMYLLLAEALNEAGNPKDEVFEKINLIRAKYRLSSVQNAWTNFSKNPTKPNSVEGRREIIKQERTIELAFEGHRFWDLRRWLDLEKASNTPIRGWDVSEQNAKAYYQVVPIFTQKLERKDYFWPIHQDELLINLSLTQSPGW